jgi:alginate O-acetyltransferase complex protein AlgI
MLFQTLAYWAFFAVVVAVYFALPLRAAIAWLAAAGFVFYGFWDWRFIALLAGSTLFNYATGRAIETFGARRAWLTVAVTGNLLLLGVFKYFGFFAATFAQAFGLDPHSLALAIVLPVGISFYTFEGIAYNVDVYRRELHAVRSISEFALFVSFFPHLVAGPIIRPKYFFPQIAARAMPDADGARWAFLQIFKGLIKKVVLADNFAVFADAYFNGAGASSAVPAIVGVVSFSLQIYFDFAGYTDIARGCAKLLGYDFPPNFDRPYLAPNIAEFWHRWHISLSTWLRDYLYIPLGGSRCGEQRTYLNLMLVMTLGGLWHGASWNFVIWGAYHGLLLTAHRAWRKAIAGTSIEASTARPLWRAGAIVVTFTLVTIGWIPFRAVGFDQTIAVFADLARFAPATAYQVPPMFWALSLFSLAWVLIDRDRGVQHAVITGGFVIEVVGVTLCLFALALFSPTVSAIPFIYFQF